MSDDSRFEATRRLGESRAFHTTLWSVILAAKEEESGRSRAALDVLIARYWQPVYFYIRRKGESIESAQDLSQDFFTALIEKKFLAAVEPQKGRFRSFLLACLDHFLINRFDRRRALKRGGGQAALSLDYTSAETALSLSPVTEETPERAFNRKWALSTLKEAVELLGAEGASNGGALPLAALTRYLSLAESGEPASYAQVAADLGVTEEQVNNYLHRARVRLLEILRDLVRGTLMLESEVSDEIRSLFSALG